MMHQISIKRVLQQGQVWVACDPCTALHVSFVDILLSKSQPSVVCFHSRRTLGVKSSGWAEKISTSTGILRFRVRISDAHRSLFRFTFVLQLQGCLKSIWAVGREFLQKNAEVFEADRSSLLGSKHFFMQSIASFVQIVHVQICSCSRTSRPHVNRPWQFSSLLSTNLVYVCA